MTQNKIKKILVEINSSGEAENISYGFHDSQPGNTPMVVKEFVKDSPTRKSLEVIEAAIFWVINKNKATFKEQDCMQEQVFSVIWDIIVSRNKANPQITKKVCKEIYEVLYQLAPTLAGITQFAASWVIRIAQNGPEHLADLNMIKSLVEIENYVKS